MTPSASSRSSRSWASRRPQPARSRKRASEIRPARGALLDDEGARPLDAAGETAWPSPRRTSRPAPLEEAARARRRRACAAPGAASAASSPRARPPPRRRARPRSAPAPGPVEPRAAPLEREPREHGARPGSVGAVDARVERVGGVELGLQLGLELGQPLVREAPLAVDELRRVDRPLAALGPLEPREVGMAAGGRIEHGAAAHRRLGAEDDAVAARGDRGRGQPELREARRPGRPGPGSPTVPWWTVSAGAVLDRLELLERDVEPVARPEARRARRARRRGGARSRSTPGSASATRCPAAARSTGSSCTWTLRTRTSSPPGLGAEHVALADRPRPERPGRDRPDPAQA